MKLACAILAIVASLFFLAPFTECRPGIMPVEVDNLGESLSELSSLSKFEHSRFESDTASDTASDSGSSSGSSSGSKPRGIVWVNTVHGTSVRAGDH